MRKIRSARQNGRKIYFTDETWLNSGHAHKKEWVDRDGLGSESKVAPGKGSRLIITDIGSETGFLEGGFLAFRSNSTADYHEDMDGERYNINILRFLHAIIAKHFICYIIKSS